MRPRTFLSKKHNHAAPSHNPDNIGDKNGGKKEYCKKDSGNAVLRESITNKKYKFENYLEESLPEGVSLNYKS